MNDDALGQLQRQVDVLRTELLAMRQVRRRVTRAAGAMVVVAGALVTVSALAAGQYECSSGQLPFGLNCFVPDSPAAAPDVNFNFKTLGDRITTIDGQIVALTMQASALSARTGNLESQTSALNLTVNGDGGVGIGLVRQPRVQSGFASTGGCGQSLGAPCSVSFPPGFFTAAPRCTATAVTPDTTGYSENPVITGISTSGLTVWKGQYTGGTTLFFYWVCVGV